MANWALVLVTVVLVVITGYYAWQTYRMVGEMRRQNRPYVFLTCVVYRDLTLVVKNDGNRAAHRIRFEIEHDARVAEGASRLDAAGQEFRDLVRVSELQVIRDGIDTLAPGGKRTVGRVGSDTHQVLKYRVTYYDGASEKFEERLTLEYP